MLYKKYKTWLFKTLKTSMVQMICLLVLKIVGTLPLILTFWYHYFKCVMTEDPANVECHRRHWSGNTHEFRSI